LRISLGGGGTDVPPYPEKRGGVVINTTIDRYAYSTIRGRNDDSVNIKCLDFNVTGSGQTNKKSEMAKIVLLTMKVTRGVDIFIHADAPIGGGLGASSAQIVALVGAINHWSRTPLTNYEISEMSYHIENDNLQNRSGKQDQYASTFGGFNFIEFHGDTTIVNPIRIDENTLNELEYRLLLCYTGSVRVSAGIIEDQISRYVRGEEEVVRALDETKAIAISIKNALLLGQVNKLGSLLNEAWCTKKKFSPKITSPHIDEMYEVACKSGALGGKLLGAGGGGYLLLLCEFDKRNTVAEKLEQIGGKIERFVFTPSGLRTWEVTAKG